VTSLIVHTPGPLTTIQDLGRAGHAHLGVPPSGALDLPAYEAANRLVANARGAAVLETTFGGLSVSADREVVVAVTGAPAQLRVGGYPAAPYTPLVLTPGTRLTLGVPRAGVRSYLAFAGGIDADPVFGSRSTDLLSGLGPAPLRAGDVLPLGRPYRAARRVPAVAPGPSPGEIWLQAWPGQRLDWFAEGALAHLDSATYLVSPHSNRVAVRLQGPPLRRLDLGELHSEGIVTGAVEVPPDGQPLVFLADHPTTVGYPVLAVVDRDDLPKLAQARPGSTVRFNVRAGRA
jgi:biotin-dependent carboxylase-like uncharacterized protein